MKLKVECAKHFTSIKKGDLGYEIYDADSIMQYLTSKELFNEIISNGYSKKEVFQPDKDWTSETYWFDDLVLNITLKKREIIKIEQHLKEVHAA